jgi:hypothetical protein
MKTKISDKKAIQLYTGMATDYFNRAVEGKVRFYDNAQNTIYFDGGYILFFIKNGNIEANVKTREPEALKVLSHLANGFALSLLNQIRGN